MRSTTWCCVLLLVGVVLVRDELLWAQKEVNFAYAALPQPDHDIMAHLVTVFIDVDDPRWYSEPVDNACQWKYIQCNENDSIISMYAIFEGIEASGASIFGKSYPSCSSRSYLNYTVAQTTKNFIKGNFSCRVFDLPNLVDFSMTYTDMTGNLSECDNICAPGGGDLQQLNFYSNPNFGGHLPNHLDWCQSLVVLGFGHNNIEGTIPDSFKSLTHTLQVLRLRSNLLQGRFPSELFYLPALRELDFAKNFLIGELPASPQFPISLTRLWLTNNWFTGEIPDWLFDRNWSVLLMGANGFDCPANSSKLRALVEANPTKDYDFFGIRDCVMDADLSPFRGSQMRPVLYQKFKPEVPSTFSFYTPSKSLTISQRGAHFFVHANINNNPDTPFEEEYGVLICDSVTIVFNQGTRASHYEEYPVTDWKQHFVFEDNTVFTFNTSFTNGLNLAVVIKVNTQNSQGPVDLKFSFDLWNYTDSNIINTVRLGFQWSIRTTISFQNGEDISSETKLRREMGSFDLNSDNFTGHIEFGGPESLMYTRSAKLYSTLALPLLYHVYGDGEDLTDTLFPYSFAVLTYPFGMAAAIETLPHTRWNVSYTDQSVTLLTSLGIRPWAPNRRVVYDPDINMALLFTSTSPQTPQQAGVTAGVIAGAVVGSLAFVGLVVGGAFGLKGKVIPYFAREKYSLAQSTKDIPKEHSETDSRSHSKTTDKSWTKSTQVSDLKNV